MIDTEFLRSLDRLQLVLKRKVYSTSAGRHESERMGEGLIFRDYKPYVPGDDFRNIDWKIYARTGNLFVRRYEEERNLVVHVLVDSSGSMKFGSGESKFEYAAKIGLGFTYMAYKNNERFNFNTFTDEVTQFKPKKGMNQLLKITDYLSNLEVGGKSDFRGAINSYKNNIKSRSLIVVISDFLYDLDDVQEVLQRYNKSEIFVVQVLDPEERELSLSGDTILEDAETHDKMRTYISNRIKNKYTEKLEDHIFKLKDISEEAEASFISVTSNTPIFETFYHILT